MEIRNEMESIFNIEIDKIKSTLDTVNYHEELSLSCINTIRSYPLTEILNVQSPQQNGALFDCCYVCTNL